MGESFWRNAGSRVYDIEFNPISRPAVLKLLFGGLMRPRIGGLMRPVEVALFAISDGLVFNGFQGV